MGFSILMSATGSLTGGLFKFGFGGFRHGASILQELLASN